MAYTVTIERKARKSLDRIEPRRTRVRIEERIATLADEPRPVDCVKLKNMQGAYRIRAGYFRIVYTVADRRQAVNVTSIGNRRDIYRQV